MSQDAVSETALPCSQCGRTFSPSDLVVIAGNRVCGECKPAYLSRIMAGGTSAATSGFHYGGFWIRFGARIIDSFVLGIPFVILIFLFMPALIKQGSDPAKPNMTAFAFFGFSFILISLGITACYEILFLKYKGGTPGKMVCGLLVVRPNGESLSWGVCAGRFAMWNLVTSGIPYINSILMLVSSIMAGTDSEKRALHDRVCNTRVIYKSSAA